MSTSFLVRYKRLGSHMHCKIFVAPSLLNSTYANTGHLCMGLEEWNSFTQSFKSPEVGYLGNWEPPTVTFLPDDGQPIVPPDPSDLPTGVTGSMNYGDYDGEG